MTNTSRGRDRAAAFRSVQITDHKDFALALLDNINGLYIQLSDIIQTDKAMKLCTLLIFKDLASNKNLVSCFKCLFVALVQEDVFVCKQLKALIDAGIDNDTTIAKLFLPEPKVKYIYTVIYLSYMKVY